MLIEIWKFLMENLFKESYLNDNGYIVSLKPNDKSTFPVLDMTHPHFLMSWILQHF